MGTCGRLQERQGAEQGVPSIAEHPIVDLGTEGDVENLSVGLTGDQGGSGDQDAVPPGAEEAEGQEGP